MPVFDFGDFCVEHGLALPSDNDLDHDEYQYLPPFHPVSANKESALQLLARIQRHAVDRRRPSIDAGHPIRPTFTFNQFTSEQHGLVPDGYPTGGIAVAVRCVNRIALPVGQSIHAPVDIILIVGEADSSEDIRSHIIERLREILKDDPNDEMHSSSAAKLFRPPHKGEWDLSLWVMPQEPGELKLYLWSPPGEGVGERPLTDFLNPILVGKGDNRLYTEAQIVPKTGEWLLTGTRCEDIERKV